MNKVFVCALDEIVDATYFSYVFSPRGGHALSMASFQFSFVIVPQNS